jgi:hypothetical protein
VQGAFCSQCGAPVAAPPVYNAPPPNAYPPPPPGYPPPPPFPGRVHRHLQTLGILWCVYGAYRALGGIIAALVLAGISTGGFLGIGLGTMGMPHTFPFVAGPWMAGMAVFVAAITLLFSALSFLVGYALLNRKPWGRVLAIVIGILQLIKLPFGTALGIYTLWVLACSRSGAEYDALADRS